MIRALVVLSLLAAAACGPRSDGARGPYLGGAAGGSLPSN